MMCDVEFDIRAEIEIMCEVLRRCTRRWFDCQGAEQTALHYGPSNAKVFFGIQLIRFCPVAVVSTSAQMQNHSHIC